jgi:hypothetical protein
MLSSVICRQIPFAGEKFLLQNLRMEYLQIAAGDLATPHRWGRGRI